jgi:hypothetical protein
MQVLRSEIPMHAPTADWLRRFAAHALKLSPTTFPLDAMRSALFAHTDLGDLAPEDAAEKSLSGAMPLDHTERAAKPRVH